mgnify:CR=1 FL=1
MRSAILISDLNLSTIFWFYLIYLLIKLASKTTMPTKSNSLSHFEAEKRDRCLNTAVGAVLFQLITYFGYVELPAASCVGVFSICLLIANYFTTTAFPLFSHFANFGASLLPYPILLLSPGEIGLARLISVANAVSIGFEQRKLFFRVSYISACMMPWFVVSRYQNPFPLEDCSYKRFEQEAGQFLVCLLFVMLISSSHSDLERKALNEAEDAVGKLKVLNAKYEQANQDLKRLLEEKDNFILLFSHETRNPLNILMGNLSILLSEVQTPRLQARIVRAKFCAELLLQNLNNILDTSKLINKGTLEIAPIGMNLPQYLHSIWDIVKLMVVKKQLKPMLVVPQALPPFVKLDSQRTSQIIINLISNSVKFTSSGSVCLTVSYLRKREISEQDFFPSTAFGNKLVDKNKHHNEEALSYRSLRDLVNESRIYIGEESPEASSFVIRECYASELMREFRTNTPKPSIVTDSSEKNGFLKLEVIDTGCGIKGEDIDKLFRRFSQVNSEASQRQMGTGLGLWISKTLVELMGGGIRVYSKPNVGTNFVVIIKADIAALSAEAGPKPTLLSYNCEKGSTQRILIVDDDPYNLETHFQMLKSLGCKEIDAVCDGWGLVNAFKSKPVGYYELFITDINMPNLNGIEAVQMVRQFEISEGRRKHVKVAFITGNSNNKEKRLCESADIRASYYLTKPLTIARLQSALQALDLLKSATYKKQVNVVTAPAAIEINSKRKPLVLCADDDILNLELFEDLIRDLGAKPVRATSGKEALEIFASRLEQRPPIDLVLIDCMMPGMDGWTASAEIKKLAIGVPVIGVTGGDVKRHEEKFRESKMNGIIRKPVQREELEQIMKKYLKL